MPRKPVPRSSEDVAREIDRLEQQRAQLEAAEHTRRGELLRQLLAGPQGDALRHVLDPLVAGADRSLFGLPAAARGPRARAESPPAGGVM